ncbi:hypothetical protein [Mesorhizobium sp. WSM4312]|uniref:hypothetical protein n=1 Tax=Mesorhizobium sp. WSM4312 TaxID=2029411 RepID=UPI00117CD773|nr:hypothetical protein [Mesorhizobium sp. WSM4312]
MVKSYSESDVKILTDALGHIASNPRMHIGDKYAPENLIARLVGDLMLAGSNNIAVERHNDWWKISSDIDWLREKDGSISYDEFYSFVPIIGAELFRDKASVILNAFSIALVTVGPDGLKVIKGSYENGDLPLSDNYIKDVIGRELLVKLPSEILMPPTELR